MLSGIYLGWSVIDDVVEGGCKIHGICWMVVVGLGNGSELQIMIRKQAVGTGKELVMYRSVRSSDGCKQGPVSWIGKVER